VFVLSGLASRRPPTVSPNWCTSYRLKCSGLVAVARLSVSQEALHPSLQLQWAEIVPVAYGPRDGPDQDFRHRQQGRLALKLLSRADCCTLQQFETSLEIGSRVAVIDLRIFVPEVVPVLSTCADPLLSQYLAQIPFVERLIGQGAPHAALQVAQNIPVRPLHHHVGAKFRPNEYENR
jgi:hypothetical protein